MNNTDICNIALSYLNKGRITALTEETEEARQCSMHYDHCRKRLLRMFSWGFAKTQVKLALRPETVLGWEYTYAYPADCIAVRFVFSAENARNKEMDRDNFDVVNFKNLPAIATDVLDAYAEYTRDEKNAENCSYEFVEAFARLLASDMALVLTGSQALQQMNYQLFQVALQEAKLQNATEKEAETQYPKEYANARFTE